MKLREFKEEFLKHITLAMAHQGRTLLESERLILEEFVKQAEQNDLNELSTGNEGVKDVISKIQAMKDEDLDLVMDALKHDLRVRGGMDE